MQGVDQFMDIKTLEKLKEDFNENKKKIDEARQDMFNLKKKKNDMLNENENGCPIKTIKSFLDESNLILEKLESNQKVIHSLHIILKNKIKNDDNFQKFNNVSVLDVIKESKETEETDIKDKEEDTLFYSAMDDSDELQRVSKNFVKTDIKTVSPTIENKLTSSSGLHPIISCLLKNNEAWIQFPLVCKDSPKIRTKLPAFRKEESVINAWSILKQNIGKDLSRITFPIIYNEPLTSLQKMCDFFEYEHLLREAVSEKDNYLKITKVFAFLFILYSTVPFRLRKPFNPLLGETFDFSQGDIKCVFEQVSHHPPIAAFYCKSNDYEIWGQLLFKINLSLKGFELIPTGPFNVKFIKSEEQFKFTRPRYSIHNYIMGKMYFWINGEMTCLNQKTKDFVTITFKPKGWTNVDDYKVEGKVTDSNGQTQLLIKGKWDSYLSIISPVSGNETIIVEKNKDVLDHHFQYYFSAFNINLNYLHPDIISRLPPTDSRFRTDLRAYEYGNLELAATEKHRLEENQRKRRKENEKKQIEYKPQWFYLDESDGEGLFKFKTVNSYFECKEKGEWPKDILDLYN